MAINPERVWHIKYKQKLTPCLEKLRKHVLENLARYITVEDLVNENKKFVQRIAFGKRNVFDVDTVAFLWSRGLPEELFCYPVDLSKREVRALFRALGRHGFQALKLGLKPFVADEGSFRIRLLEWLAGQEEVPEVVVEWLKRGGWLTEGGQ